MARITIKNNGLDALTKRLKAFGKGLTLTVGVHAAEGAVSAATPTHATKSAAAQNTGGLTVAEIATINEYGLGNNPERSFIRDWYDQNEARNKERLRMIGVQVLKGAYSAVVGLGRLGALFQGEIQLRISNGIPPPNAPETIARKGSSTPLIDTGQLRSSILWKVEES